MKTIKTIEITKIDQSEGVNSCVCPVTDQVIVEHHLYLEVNSEQKYDLFCTPRDLPELVTGFLFTKGLINNITDIHDLKIENDMAKVITEIKPTSKKAESSNLKINSADMFQLMQELQNRQKLFKQTGGAHAAAIFNARAEIIVFMEDVARHNALDKAIGKCLLDSIAIQNCGVVLSSRVSHEMMQKVIRAKMQMVFAVSAPTSLAVKMAKENAITLCGFVRGERANVYNINSPYPPFIKEGQR